MSIPLRSLLIYTPALPKQALAACASCKGLERPHLTPQYFTGLQSERVPFGEIASKRRWSYLPFLMKRLHCAQFVARCKEDILKAKGVKPTLSPNLNTLATVEALDVKRLLFIGVGCQVLFCAYLLKAHLLQTFDQPFYRHACLCDCHREPSCLQALAKHPLQCISPSSPVMWNCASPILHCEEWLPAKFQQQLPYKCAL